MKGICLLTGFLALGLSAVVAAESHDDSFSQEGLFKADAGQLADTKIVADLEAPLKSGANVLWCGTLQLAWNQAVDLVGAPIHLKPRSAAAEALDQSDFSGSDLDPGSYVAVADFERNGVEAKIRAALEHTFGGAASPELIPPTPAHPGPLDFLAYAYLYKNLAFAQPFLSEPFEFEGKPVKGFGFPERGNAAMRDEVSIYDYRSPDDFIVSLQTKAQDDELILAKVAPGATLGGTVRAVLKRVDAASPEEPGEADSLSVPKLNFDLRRSFPELEGPTRADPQAKIKVSFFIKSVQQLIRFQLNEKGAILKSEAVIEAVGAAPGPEFNRPMIFDQPFLILLKQRESPRPYFAAWIGNPTLLVADKQED